MKKYIYILVIIGSLVQLGLLVRGLIGTPLPIQPSQLPAVTLTNSQFTCNSCSASPSATPSSSAKTDTSASFVPEHIVIDKVTMALPIVSVPLQNGTWAVHPHVANYAEGTSLVNAKSGNVGLYGHERVDAFLNIYKLEKGDAIVLLGSGEKATYKVTSSAVVDPTDVNVFYPTSTPQLTLITCSGVFYDKRYMVRASLVNITKQI